MVDQEPHGPRRCPLWRTADIAAPRRASRNVRLGAGPGVVCEATAVSGVVSAALPRWRAATGPATADGATTPLFYRAPRSQSLGVEFGARFSVRTWPVLLSSFDERRLNSSRHSESRGHERRRARSTEPACARRQSSEAVGYDRRGFSYVRLGP